jgi:hypothetical protein
LQARVWLAQLEQNDAGTVDKAPLVVAVHDAVDVWLPVPHVGQALHALIWHAYVTQGGRLQARLWDWQLPHEAADATWPWDDTQDAMAVWVATPQLGQTDHWPIWHEYVTQGGMLQARLWDWQLPHEAAEATWP